MHPIHTIDLGFQGIAHAVAAYVVETSEGPVVVECGPHSTFPALERGLKAIGYSVNEVRHVLLTHIHLDHAGAAWAFAEAGATVYVHPLGSMHLAYPERLMQSAKMIYQDSMDRLWGEMRPIADEKLKSVAHEENITIGDTEFKAWHTPGHAIHHIAWQLGSVAFTGDVAGVCIEGGLIAPPCPPPDIHIEDWQASLNLLRSLELSALYLTHFGKITDILPHLDALEKRLLNWAEWIRPYYEQGTPQEFITPKFQAFVNEELIASGLNEQDRERYETANPSWMSVAGLMRYWKKKG